MQVIWSRAAQTSSCRCNACFHSASKLARRTTTAATKRQLKASDVFTLCYSAMFATAAVVDAKRKDMRKKQWDQAIELVKAGGSSGSANDSSAVLEWAMIESRTNSVDNCRTNDSAATATINPSEQRDDSTESLPPALDDRSWVFSQMKKDDSLGSQLRLDKSYSRESMVANAVWEGGFEHSAYEDPPDVPGPLPRKYRLRPREPLTRTHIDYMELMASKLVQELVCATESLSPDRADSHQQSLESVLKQRPKYALLTSQTIEQRMAMNSSIETIFAENISSHRIDTIITKVCYKLLTSSAPPNITTYNIMLTHFTRLQQHRHAQAVINSFFHDSQLKPDSWTISAILDHYTAARDKAGFQHMLRRMRALDGNMRIRRVHISKLNDPKIQAWAEKWKATHRNEFLYAKVHRDSMIFESLIRGALQFFGIKWAVIYVQTAFREGHHITLELFVQLARKCLYEEDKDSTVRLLSAFVARWQQDNGRLTLESRAAARKFIYILLDLCDVRQLKKISPQELSLGGFRDIQGTMSWLYCLRAESIGWQLAKVALIVSKLKSMVSMYFSGYSAPEPILSRMLRYHQKAPLDGAKGRRERATLKYRKMAVARYAVVAEDLAQLFIRLVHAALPIHSQQIYDGLVKSSHTLTSKKIKLLVDLRFNRCDTCYRSLGSVEIQSKISHITFEAKTDSSPAFLKNFGMQIYVSQSTGQEDRWPGDFGNHGRDHMNALPHSRSCHIKSFSHNPDFQLSL